MEGPTVVGSHVQLSDNLPSVRNKYKHPYLSFPSLPRPALPSKQPQQQKRCMALFNNLSPAALLASSGPSDTWECLGIGVTLFERENPYWWERAHPEDDERRQKALAEHTLKKSRSRRRLDGPEGEHDGTRRYTRSSAVQ